MFSNPFFNYFEKVSDSRNLSVNAEYVENILRKKYFIEFSKNFLTLLVVNPGKYAACAECKKHSWLSKRNIFDFD